MLNKTSRYYKNVFCYEYLKVIHKRKMKSCLLLFFVVIFAVFLILTILCSETNDVDKNKLVKNEYLTITVKTTFLNHNTRVRQILETWYQLEPENIYFVSDAFDPIMDEKLKNHFINTSCGYKHDSQFLGCKLNKELNFMLQKNATWSCHFDDDNYVNIPILKQILADFDHTLPYYLGRIATTNPIKHNGSTFWFAIGGAGICLSNAALQVIKNSILQNKLYEVYAKIENMPDDWGFGYMMDKHNITLTEVVSFLSQYDSLDRLPLKAIKETPVFSFENNIKTYVNLPYFYDPKDDPYKFITLHCFLFPDKCSTKFNRLKINVYVNSKLDTYGSFVLPSVKYHNT